MKYKINWFVSATDIRQLHNSKGEGEKKIVGGHHRHKFFFFFCLILFFIIYPLTSLILFQSQSLLDDG